MKAIVTALFLGIFMQTSAQTLEEIKRHVLLIKNPETVVNDTTGISILPKIKFLCDEHFAEFEFPERSTKWDYYNVIDLNLDGRDDLIYSGPCLPYDQTTIWINDGLKLKSVFEYAGRIVSIKKFSDRTVLAVFAEGCCCDYYSDLVQITIHSDSRVEEKWITFMRDTEVIITDPIEVSVSGTLRTQPEIDDKQFKDPCTDDVLHGNHLKYIVGETEVIQLNRDGPWSLVLYPEDATRSWIGWIKMEE